ncbi:MAG TPA: hypothetical protein VMW10_07810, partial [Alphaproteobacteria bacterium]|nr:hypothetical protein [Alphaproteobacteria bacterium]
PFGVEVRGYQESTPLRTATSEMFRQKDIPWIEGLDPKVAGEGDHRLGNFLGLPDKSHERTNEGHLDYGYGRCWEAVLLGSEYTTKPGRRYLDDKEAKNIAPLGTQFGPLVERARALSTAIGNTREYVVERLRRKDNDRISEKALQVALLSGFL